MKIIHIIGILFIVGIIAVVISTFTDTSTYVDFSTASKHPNKEFHIIGTLNLEKGVNYDAGQDANQFSFYMIDSKGEERLVRYYDAKPQDFEKSEQVVIIGKVDGDAVTASSLLLKCPSKYNDDQVPQEYKETEYATEGT
ncbi:MAG TPA: cytochrome c maturation protein CcmE [Bacteroidales bacterium]|nr:cytochrome c maturation protein CcmE [Bacteroidales bacterium]